MCLDTVLLKDEELAKYFEYGKAQLLLTVVTLILTWLRLLNWCRPILPCQLSSSDTLTERWWCAKGFCCEVFFFEAAAYSQLLCGLLDKYLLVSELHNAHIVRQVFFDDNFRQLNLEWQFESCVAVCSRSSWAWRFLEDITYYFIANLSQSLTVKEFWKSVKILQSYWHNFTATFLWNAM